jgi:hypothetical protein
MECDSCVFSSNVDNIAERPCSLANDQPYNNWKTVCSPSNFMFEIWNLITRQTIQWPEHTVLSFTGMRPDNWFQQHI